MNKSEQERSDIRLVMTGRSSMALWFKHWNWPRFLRRHATYRSWPISYEAYSRDGLDLSYSALVRPGKDLPAVPWGTRMVESFERIVEEQKPEAAFFKFCFVDFRVTADTLEDRLERLQSTIEAVNGISEARGFPLIIGNAIPLVEPSPSSVELQRRYNAWLAVFDEQHPNVRVFDLYGLLADDTGALPRSRSRADDDPHIGDDAYALLNEPFFSMAAPWLKSLLRQP